MLKIKGCRSPQKKRGMKRLAFEDAERSAGVTEAEEESEQADSEGEAAEFCDLGIGREKCRGVSRLGR